MLFLKTLRVVITKNSINQIEGIFMSRLSFVLSIAASFLFLNTAHADNKTEVKAPLHNFLQNKFEYHKITDCTGAFGLTAIRYWNGRGKPGTKRALDEYIFTDLCFDQNETRLRFTETIDGLYLLQKKGPVSQYERNYKNRRFVALTVNHFNEFDKAGADGNGIVLGTEKLKEVRWSSSSALRPQKLKYRKTHVAGFNQGFIVDRYYTSSIPPGKYKISGWGNVVSKDDDRKIEFGVPLLVSPYLTGTVEVNSAADIKVKMKQLGTQEHDHPTKVKLSLTYKNGELYGDGTAKMENERKVGLRDDDWEDLNINNIEVRGRTFGKTGQELYLILIFEGYYTLRNGKKYPANGSFTLNAVRDH
jgi:hypothetical protein